MAVKLLSKILEEDNTIIHQLNNANDGLAQKLSKCGSNDDFNADDHLDLSGFGKSQQLVKPTFSSVVTQTELESEEIKLIATMLSKKEVEASKSISEIKKNKIYVKLCENKIKNLEAELSKYYRMDIDQQIIDHIQHQFKQNLGNPEICEPTICILYPNYQYFKNGVKKEKMIEIVGELRMNNNQGI